MDRIINIKNFFKQKSKDKHKYLLMYKNLFLSAASNNFSYFPGLTFSGGETSLSMSTTWTPQVSEQVLLTNNAYTKSFQVPYTFAFKFTQLQVNGTNSWYIGVGVRDLTSVPSPSYTSAFKFDTSVGNVFALGFWVNGSISSAIPYVYYQQGNNNTNVVQYGSTTWNVTLAQAFTYEFSLKEDFDGNMLYNIYFPAASTHQDYRKVWRKINSVFSSANQNRQIFMFIAKDAPNNYVFSNVNTAQLQATDLNMNQII